MTGRTGSNLPGGRESIDKLRQLQRRLWSAAKRQPGRRFHALLDRIYSRDVLRDACVRTAFGRSGTPRRALETLRRRGARGGNHVLDADIRDYFGNIAHGKLLTLVARRISDWRLLKLLRQWLHAAVMKDGQVTATVAGTLQRGVRTSPLRS